MVSPPLCHSDRSASGVEESTTWDDKPTQGKTCYLGRFLDSLRSLGMTCRGVFRSTKRVIFATEPAPRRGWMALGQRRYIVPCIREYHSTAQVIFATWRAADCRPYDTFVPFYRILNVFITNLRFENCQLSTVHCQFKSFLTRWPDYC